MQAGRAGLPVVFINSACEALTGWKTGDIVGAGLDELIDGGELPVAADAWSPENEARGVQHWRLKSGGDMRLEVRQVALYDRPGRPAYWLLTASGPAVSEPAEDDATLRNALQDARRRIRTLERHDAATGVPNEDAFGEVLRRDWALARRERRRVAVVLFQVDCLDRYRASLGRHATNSVLRKVAHAINGSLRRASDVGARVGDDRFVALIGTATAQQAAEFAERVLTKVVNLAIPHPRSPIARNITISYGVASTVPEHQESCESLLDAAAASLAAGIAERKAERRAAERAAESV